MARKKPARPSYASQVAKKVKQITDRKAGVKPGKTKRKG